MVAIFQSALAHFSITIPLGKIVTGRVFFGVMMIVSFVAAVMIIPNEDVKFKYALVGGLFFAVALGIAKFLFKLYVTHFFYRYNLIYGSLTILVVPVLWIYYLANILLLSSELVNVLQKRANGYGERASDLLRASERGLGGRSSF